MVVVRGERADAFDEKLCVVCVVFEGKRGVCGVSLRRVSIETRSSQFHINQSLSPGDHFKMMMMMMMTPMKTTTRTFRARRRRRKRRLKTTTKKTHLIYRAHFLSSSVKETHTTVRERKKALFLKSSFCLSLLLRLSRFFMWRHLWTHFFPMLFSQHHRISSCFVDQRRRDQGRRRCFSRFCRRRRRKRRL